jgi:hypothetical protein
MPKLPLLPALIHSKRYIWLLLSFFFNLITKKHPMGYDKKGNENDPNNLRVF